MFRLPLAGEPLRFGELGEGHLLGQLFGSGLPSWFIALRSGVPVKRVRVVYAMCEESRRWWFALHIVRVLLKCGGNVLHVRLSRWLGHRMASQELRDALAWLRDKHVVETYQVKGTDPLRPITWHRFTKRMAEALDASRVAE